MVSVELMHCCLSAPWRRDSLELAKRRLRQIRFGSTVGLRSQQLHEARMRNLPAQGQEDRLDRAVA